MIMDEITDLSSLPMAETFDGDHDVLLLSEHDIYDYSVYRSKYVKTGAFLENLFDEVFALVDFKSMAYENSAEYAPANHTHAGYTSVAVECLYEPQEYGIDNLVSVGNFVLNGSYKTLFAPLSAVAATYTIPDEIVRPKLGSAKLVYKPTLQPVDIDSPSFDGWVYPAGQSYPACNFVLSDELLQKFPDPGNSANFKLARIDQFIKLYPGKATSNAPFFTYQNGRTVTAPHTHTLKAELKCNATLSISIKIGSGYGHTNVIRTDDGSTFTAYTHKGSFKNTIVAGTNSSGITVNMNMPDIAGKLNVGNKQIAGISYPTHIMLPIMVYIGDTYKSRRDNNA